MSTYSSLYSWVHQASVSLYSSGFILIGDKHDGFLHQFRYLRGTQFPDIRELVSTQRKITLEAIKSAMESGEVNWQDVSNMINELPI